MNEPGYAMDDYAALVPPRDIVPTPREVQVGAAPDGFVFKPAPPPPPEPKASFWDIATQPFRALDPRKVAGAGPILPLVLFALLGTLAYWDDLAFAMLLPFIKSDLGFDFQFMFTLQSVVGIVTVLMAPVAGYFADRVKRVWMLRAGALLGNFGSLLTGLAPGPGAIVGARFVGGLGPGLENPASFPLLTDYYPQESRARVFSFLGAARSMGVTAGFVVVFVLVFKMGMTWRVVMVGTGAASSLVALALFRLREPVRGALDRQAMGASKEDSLIEQKPASWAEAWRTARSIGTLRRLWYAEPFVTVAGQGLGFFLFFVIQDKVVRGELGGPGISLLNSPNAIYLFSAIPALISVIAIGFGAPVANRLLRTSPGKIMVLAGASLALSALTTLFLVVTPWLLFASILSWFSIGILSLAAVARSTLLSVVLPARIRGQGAQTIAPWQLVGFLILPTIGRVGDMYGPLQATMLLVVLFLVGAAVTASAGANAQRDIRAALAASLADQEATASRRRGANKMIICREVEVDYDGTKVLFGVDFDVEEGEIVALLGTNGAGKSTLLRAIAGVHEASNGAIFLDGEDITHKPSHLNARDGVVFMPGGHAVFPSMTVRENLRAASWLYRDDDEYVQRRTEEVLELFPALQARIDQVAGNMSGGEQQMLALGQALLMRPRLLMIDELSLGLAPSIVEAMLDVLRRIHAEGTTILLVEQSLNVALTIAERCVFMEKGQIRFDGPTTELLTRPDLVRSVFLGGVGGGMVTRLDRRRTEAAHAEGPRLVVENVSVAYGGVRALDNVSLTVDEATIVGIIGPNGAGKTTLFDVVSGFVVPEEGVISLDGADISRMTPDARARLGLCRSFQNTKLFPSLTVRENIAVALERRFGRRSALAAAAWVPGVRRTERRAFRRVDHLVDLLNLGAFADKFLAELSTGSRRMVDLACIMAGEPAVLLLDEPSSGLAQAEIEVLAPVVQRVARESGCGVVVVEHDIPLVSRMSDRLVAMELGGVVAVGTPHDVLADPRVVSSYLNASDAVVRRSGSALAQAIEIAGQAARGVAPLRGED